MAGIERAARECWVVKKGYATTRPYELPVHAAVSSSSVSSPKAGTGRGKGWTPPGRQRWGPAKGADVPTWHLTEIAAGKVGGEAGTGFMGEGSEILRRCSREAGRPSRAQKL